MGTSSSYRGPSGKNPLIPSWLDGAQAEPAPATAEQPVEVGAAPTQQTVNDPARYQTARLNMSKYLSSGGTDRRAFGRAVSDYVSRSSGGAGRAAARMGSSRSSGGRLLGFLSDVRARGLAPALEAINLGSLVGKAIDELFFGLADYVCPTDGSVDAGIPRDAYAEMVVDAVAAGITSLDELTGEQVKVIFERFVAHSIFDRLTNDIANGGILLTKDAKEAAAVQDDIREFIYGAVHDAVDRQDTDFRGLSQADARDLTTTVYEQSFAILEALGREEQK